MDKKLLTTTFRNVFLAALYIFGVSQLMFYGNSLFGKADTRFTPFLILLLFSLSAAVVGGLVFGQAIYLFFDNKKKESVLAAVYSVGWLFVITVIVFGIAIAIK